MAEITEVPPPNKKKSVTREFIETIALALLIAVVVRWIIVEVYQVKGSSMENSLHNQERVLVNKFVYKVLRKPERGDIIVFKAPRPGERDFIKRVIGVAGDTVELRQGTVYVNGEPLADPGSVLPANHDYEPFTVPVNHVWVLGDNRGNSDDSRFFGPIHVDSIRGMAFLRIWPLGEMTYFKSPYLSGAD